MEQNLDYQKVHNTILNMLLMIKNLKKNELLKIYEPVKNLEQDYFYKKWIHSDKKFTGFYLNLGEKYQKYLNEYAGIETDQEGDYVNIFFLFCCNWDSPGDFFESLWPGQREYYFNKASSPKNRNFISGEQMCRFYLDKITQEDQYRVLNWIFETYNPTGLEDRAKARARNKYIEEQWDNSSDVIVIPEHLA